MSEGASMIEKSGVQRLSESQWKQMSLVIEWEPLSATQFVVEISKSLLRQRKRPSASKTAVLQPGN